MMLRFCLSSVLFSKAGSERRRGEHAKAATRLGCFFVARCMSAHVVRRAFLVRLNLALATVHRACLFLPSGLNMQPTSALQDVVLHFAWWVRRPFGVSG
jgi:hypothetical protein